MSCDERAETAKSSDLQTEGVKVKKWGWRHKMAFKEFEDAFPRDQVWKPSLMQIGDISCTCMLSSRPVYREDPVSKKREEYACTIVATVLPNKVWSIFVFHE